MYIRNTTCVSCACRYEKGHWISLKLELQRDVSCSRVLGIKPQFSGIESSALMCWTSSYNIIYSFFEHFFILFLFYSILFLLSKNCIPFNTLDLSCLSHFSESTYSTFHVLFHLLRNFACILVSLWMYMCTDTTMLSVHAFGRQGTISDVVSQVLSTVICCCFLSQYL